MKQRGIVPIFIGLMLLLFGAGVLLNNFGVWDFWSLMGAWWPVVIILLGVVSWLPNPRAFIGPLILVTIGVLFLLWTTDIVEVNVFALIWPILIIFVGLSILLGRIGHQRRVTKDQELDSSAFFGEDKRQVKSQDFKGGSASAMFGSCNIDMREAEFNKDASMNVFVAFGGIELFVPKDVEIILKTSPILGGVEDHTQQESGTGKKLTIHGTVMFGSLEIKN